jgi:hypothetical protein
MVVHRPLVAHQDEPVIPRNYLFFLPMKKYTKSNVLGTKEKYGIVYFKYFTKYVPLS